MTVGTLVVPVHTARPGLSRHERIGHNMRRCGRVPRTDPRIAVAVNRACPQPARPRDLDTRPESPEKIRAITVSHVRCCLVSAMSWDETRGIAVPTVQSAATSRDSHRRSNSRQVAPWSSHNSGTVPIHTSAAASRIPTPQNSETPASYNVAPCKCAPSMSTQVRQSMSSVSTTGSESPSCGPRLPRGATSRRSFPSRQTQATTSPSWLPP